MLAALAPLAGIAARLSHVSPAQAEEATAEALADAQAQYESVQAQIDEIAYEYQLMSQELDSTLGSIEAKNSEIAQTQADIEEKQAELSSLQDELSTYVTNSYKHGNASVLDVVLNSTDFEELFRNIYYLNKVSDAESQLISQAKDVKAQLEEQQEQLQSQLSELEDLRAQQQSQLDEMESRQNDAYVLLSSLDEQVQQLTEQYNQELIAQAEAAAAEQAAAEAAAAADAAESSSSDSDYSSGSSYSGGSGSASAVVSSCYSTPSPGSGLCAGWVTNVFNNAGLGYYGGNACDMYASWCYLSDQSSLQTGMIVAVSSHPHTSAGQIYGHVGIYVGGGTVMDNIGYIRSIDIDSWVSYYGGTVTPRWGWLGGVTLS
jgi:peptidoglycan DL-endopeptidase CwlO